MVTTPKNLVNCLRRGGFWTGDSSKNPRVGVEKLCEAAFEEVSAETGLRVDKEKLKNISVSEDIVEDAYFVTLGFLGGDFGGEAGHGARPN